MEGNLERSICKSCGRDPDARVAVSKMSEHAQARVRHEDARPSEKFGAEPLQQTSTLDPEPQIPKLHAQSLC